MTTRRMTLCRLSPLSSLASLARLIKGTPSSFRQTGGDAEALSRKIRRLAHDADFFPLPIPDTLSRFNFYVVFGGIGVFLSSLNGVTHGVKASTAPKTTKATA